MGSGSDSLTLSRRLDEVLDLLCQGKAPAAIGRELHLSVHTVRGYVAELKRRHGVGTTQELLVLALAGRCSCAD